MTDSQRRDDLPDADRQLASNHQPDRIDIRSVTLIGFGLAAMVVLSMIAMAALFRGMDAAGDGALPGYAASPVDSDPRGPRLSATQARQLRELRAEQRRVLDSYEWIDQQQGVARIPIDRAIELVADDLPARENVE